MTEKPKKPTKAPFERKTYTDDTDIPRVVLVPAHETDLKKGIPLSLDLTELFGHMPQEFQRAFYKALHAQGLVEPKDYFQRDAAERYRRALISVIKHDFLSIQALANEELQHGR